MGDGKKFEQAILAIQETLHKAERQLSDLGQDLQFLCSLDGDVEIVRRRERGRLRRPKVVIAKLTGTDPLLWRGDYPPWLRVLAPNHEVAQLVPKEGNGQPAANGGKKENGSSTPPTNTGGQH